MLKSAVALPVLLFILLLSGVHTATAGSVEDTGQGDRSDSDKGKADVSVHDLTTIESLHFVVIAKAYREAQVVKRMGDEVVNLMKKYVNVPNEFMRPVFVQLIPDDEATFKSPYRLYLNKHGEAIVSIRWGKKTRFSNVCQAVVRGFILQWTYIKYGYKRTKRIPAWLDLAFSLKLEARLRPRYHDFFKDKAKHLPVLSISQILQENAALKYNLKNLALHSYWLFECIRKESLSRSVFNRFITRVLAGQDVKAIIDEEYIGSKGRKDAKSEHLWWAVMLHDLVSGNNAWLYSMEESRYLIHRYGIITVEIDGADTRFSLKEVWEQRKAGSVRAAIQWALREIKLEIYSINPVYHNAMHSLGRIYETLLGDNHDDYLKLKAQFSEDYYIAAEVQKRISKLMAEPVTASKAKRK